MLVPSYFHKNFRIGLSVYTYTHTHTYSVGIFITITFGLLCINLEVDICALYVYLFGTQTLSFYHLSSAYILLAFISSNLIFVYFLVVSFVGSFTFIFGLKNLLTKETNFYTHT